MPNLSLLSRGTGQVVKKTQEKLEVHFEPEDYLNWKSHEGYGHVSRLLNERQFMKGCWGLYLPKTYSTKTGALVLYSEDLAEPSWKQRGGMSGQQGLRHRRNKLQIELHTLQDLTRAILAYGGRQKDQKETAWHPHLHFLKKPDSQIDRQIRPGYSAKRYLFRLSQTWDPSIIYRLQCAGYIRDPLLLQNSLNTPNHRIGQQDLSAVPKKYHLLPAFPSFWAELSQHIHPGIVAGQSYSVQKEDENRENQVEGDEVETGGQRRARVPVRVSVRRLSLELRSSPAKEATWSQNAACTKVPQGTEEDHQDVEHSMEGQWHGEKPHQTESQEPHEKLNQTVKSSVGSATIDTSQLLSERSYMTFYGGYFPGRKKPYSVKQGHLNNQDGKEGHLIETGFFPPIQSAMDSEQGVVRVEHRKQAPETLKFPSISEESPRVQVPHRKQFRSSDPPMELLILPLLIQLQTQPETKAKNQTAASCDKSRSEADDDCEKLLAPSPHDLISGPEGTTEQHQMTIGENPEIHQGSFFLPPITNRKFTLEGKKAGTRGVNAGKEGNYKRDGDLFTQNALPGLDLLPPKYGKKGPGNQSSKTDFKMFSSSTMTSSTSKTLPIGITRGTLPEELRECYNGTSLGSLIMGPDGEIVCLSLLGSVQDAEVPAQFSFVPDKGDCGLPLETGTSLHINSHETSPLRQEMNDKKCSESLGAAVLKKGEPQSFRKKKLEVTLPLEAGALKKGDSGAYTAEGLEIRTRQGYRHCIENEHKGNGGSVSEFKAESQHGQDSLSGYLRLTQDQHTKLCSDSPMHSNGVTQTPGAKQHEDSNFVKDPGRQMDGAPGSHSISHLGSYGGHTESPTEEMSQDSESGNYLLGLSSHRPMLQENVGVAMSHSEKQHVTEGEKTTLTKELCKQTAASVNAFQDTEVAESKTMKRQRNELTKMHPVSKAQKKSSNKDKRQNREEFVVGKPREKKADEKRTSSLRKKTTGVKRPETIQEPKHKEGGEEAEAADQSSAAAGDEELRDDRSPSPFSSPIKDHLLPLESPQFCFEHYDNPSGSSPVHEKFIQTHPIITTVSVTELDTSISNEVSEDLPRNQQEEKLSRDRMRAEKAERRRLEVERKRREQEEQKWKQQEQQEHMEKMKEELEQEQKRRAEEMRLRKQELEEQHQRQEEEAARKLQHEKAAHERIRQQQEEYRRKLLELQKKRQQEEQERAEAEKRRQKEREMWLEVERQRLAEMAEEERLEYKRREQEEEEQARHEAEERRKKAEEAARLALEEAKTQAQLLARQREALEQHVRFQRELLGEASGLEHTQQISRPWVYSYFQLLQMLGLETAKENK
ncbi:uncharacterized protein KIAA2012 homolog isoform X3 [Gopherus evgoodei]|uniref:uncharacterized protein KIAA2012 homolog isoform X3 n=1 Tax=Gopherus evgoodei TaxID=1825980 RepID=UPI0011D0049E|nr:uncharacterized protein KIAA2012 homolog isoform X3 [Gopherus evgoodei]